MDIENGMLRDEFWTEHGDSEEREEIERTRADDEEDEWVWPNF